MSVISLAAWEVGVLAGVALAIAALSTCLAMESAALFIPAFTMFFPVVLPGFPAIELREAVGLTLIIMFFGQTSANVGYWYRDQIDVSLAALSLVWAIPMAILGRIVSYVLPDELLLLVFVGLLLGLSAIVYRHGKSEETHEHGLVERERAETERPRSGVGLQGRDHLAMGVGGSVTGLVGLGMGEISNTLLTVRDDMSVHRSIGTSTLILYLTVLSAAITNLVLARFGGPIGVTPSIPWPIAAIVAPAVLVGGQIGPSLNSRLPRRIVRQTLVALYIVVSAVTVLRLLG